MLDQLFNDECRRYNITIYENVRMVHAAFLTPYPWGAFRLSVRQSLTTPEKVEAAGMQIARIVLGHDFQRSGFRQEYVNRREWDHALLWVARRTISDRLMSKASRAEWDSWELAEAADVTEAIAWRRWEDWMASRGNIVPFRPRIQVDQAIFAAESPFFD